ncbi:hypothetical protein OROHE_014949 [Orobanche hederae]
MAFFRMAGSMLGRSVSSHISQDISFFEANHLSSSKMDVISEALCWRTLVEHR